MTDNLTHRKYQLIQEIVRIDNERLIEALEEEIRAAKDKNQQLWKSIIKPPKAKLSLEGMIAEQSYVPIVGQDFFAEADKVGIDESIEDLLRLAGSG